MANQAQTNLPHTMNASQSGARKVLAPKEETRTDTVSGNIVRVPFPDELVVRDADGRFKILRKGKLEEWATAKSSGSHASGSVGPAIPRPPSATAPAEASVSSRPISRHYIDVGDEEEIAALKDTGDEARVARVSSMAGEKADALIGASGITLGAEVRPRLWRAVVSRLKDVRDLTETKDVLTRATSLGGVGLDGAQIQILLKQVEEARAEFEEEVGVGKFQITSTSAQSGSAAGGKLQTIPTIKTQISETAKVPPPPVRESPKIAIETPPLSKPSVRPFVHPSYGTTDDRSQKTDTPAPTSDFRLPTSDVRPQMQEVRAAHRVVGPVEELRLIGLEDFRRLGATAQLAAVKVREKVELLADESLIQRSEGVTAWKSSPVHQLYLAVGRECMEKGVTVKSVISGWQAHNRITLTPEEFDAIADLNQKLAY